MTVRDKMAKSRGETGAWSPGTDTLPLVRVWCLPPSAAPTATAADVSASASPARYPLEFEREEKDKDE